MLYTVGCGVWSLECRVSSVECRVSSDECGVWSVECGVWNVECGVWSVEWAIDRPMTITTTSLESLSTCTAICLTRVRRNLRKSLPTIIHKLVYV